MLATAHQTIFAHAGGLGTGDAPKWLLLYGAIAVMVAAYLYARATFRTARLSEGAGTAMPKWFDDAAAVARILLEILGVVFLILAIAAGLFGSRQPASNVAGPLLFIVAWYVPIVVNAVFGNVHAAANPFITIVRGLTRIGVKFRKHDNPATWTAPVMIAAFVWYEFAYFDSFSPKNCAIFVAAYVVAVAVGVGLWGAEWLESGEGFGMFFRIVGSIGILHRGGDDRVQIRIPGSGLTRTSFSPTQLSTVLVVLTGFVYDIANFTTASTSQTIFGKLARGWANMKIGKLGWSYTFVATIQLAWILAAIVMIWMAVSKRSWWATVALVPVTVGLTIAHNYLRILTDVQNTYAQLSDPFGKGSDIFGTNSYYPSSLGTSITTIGYVKAVVVAIFGALALVVLHDRAIERVGVRQALQESMGPILCVIGTTVICLNAILGG